MRGDPVYVVAARRTPIGRLGGIHRHRSADELAADAITAVLRDLGAGPGEVGEVVLGNVWGPGGNPARVAALRAGLGEEVPGTTVDVQCASGLAAINTAARLVASGAVDLCLAGGVESMSTAPMRTAGPATDGEAPRFVSRAPFTPASWTDPDMGPAADAVAARHGIGRERQDAFAARSHRLAVAATATGRFRPELAGDGATTTDPPVADESPRARFTEAALAKLSPAHGPTGTVTIGSTAPFADGAAVVALASASLRDRLAPGPALQLIDGATAGVDPTLPGTGPIAAVRTLLRQPGRHDHQARPDLDDVELVELTEAFAGQALACLDALGLDVLGADDHRVNIGGGALALGHPWGASGAVLVVRLFTELVRAPDPARAGGSGTAIAAVAGAGGSAVASLFQRTS